MEDSTHKSNIHKTFGDRRNAENGIFTVIRHNSSKLNENIREFLLHYLNIMFSSKYQFHVQNVKKNL
jgi:hypothetical protein